MLLLMLQLQLRLATITTAVNITDDDAGPADAVIDLAPDVMSIDELSLLQWRSPVFTL